MTQYGISDVQTHVYTLVFKTGTKEHQDFVEDMMYVFRLFLPFFHKWTQIPDDYEEIYQQAKQEMQQPDFVGTQTLLTCWGRTSI
jgi:hypothetical protein